MKKILSTILCFLILFSCAVPVFGATGVPKEVMDATKSVVRILSKYYDGSATGSGFVIKNEPGEVLIVTNDHVVAGNPYSISVWVSDDELVDAEIVFTTSAKDLCVLRVTESIDMRPLTLSTEDPEHGAAIYVVGYPGAGDILSDTQAHTSESVTITDGIISAIRTFTIESGEAPVKLLQVNAAINSGNSGGPLFDSEGVVIGVNTYKVNANSQGVFGSVAVSELLALLDQRNIEIPVVASGPSNSVAVIIGAVAVLIVVILLISTKKKKVHKKTARKTRGKEKTVTLTAYMQQYPQGLGVSGAVSLLLGAAIQLRNLHNDGKLHLQICPENILISANGTSIKEPGNQETGRYNSGFAAPEVYRGAGFGVTSDIYSFSAVLLYAVTGKVPANSLQQELVDQQIGTIAESAFADTLRKAMAFGILERTQSMQELISGIAVYNTAVQELKPVREDLTPEAAKREEPTRTTVAVKEKQQKQTNPRKQKERKKRTNKELPVAAVLACVIAVAVFSWKPFAAGGTNILLSSNGETETMTPLSPEATAYAEAETLLANGETAKAAIAFGKLGDYKDARQRSFELWDKVAVRKTIAVGDFHTLALKNDGTVYVAGENVVDWNATTQKTERIDEEYSQCNVNDWSDIVAVSARGANSAGLKADGTVVTAGRLEKYGLKAEIDAWQDIVSVSVGDYILMGLKMDGTVVTASRHVDAPDVSDWSDIIAIGAETHLVGLKSDGTVVAAGNNQRGQCNVESWTDIIKISTGRNQTFGLKVDNTVVATGLDDKGQCNVQNWSDIVDLTTEGDFFTVGVKSDGTTVIAGRVQGWYNIQSWTDITSVAASKNHAVGLKSDGTVVAVATSKAQFSQCNVSDWTDIAIPGELKMIPLAK